MNCWTEAIALKIMTQNIDNQKQKKKENLTRESKQRKNYSKQENNRNYAILGEQPTVEDPWLGAEVRSGGVQGPTRGKYQWM